VGAGPSGLSGPGVVFLRAINVGGRRVTNDDLRAVGERAGLAATTPYQASGNLLFADADYDGLVDRLGDEFRSAFGFAAECFVWPLSALVELLDDPAAEPMFTERPKAAVHIGFLDAAPGADRLAAIAALEGPDDRFLVHNGGAGGDGGGLWAVLWHRNGGLAESELTQPQLVRAFGLHTFRTRGTVERIAAKLKPLAQGSG
jgi:uncharacterized protein (DUF1697 family)